MPKRVRVLTMVFLLAVTAGGCVSIGRFETKEAEADRLARSLQTLQLTNSQLTEENLRLKDRLKQLNDDFAGLSAQRDKLAKDRDDLERVLKSRSGTLPKTVGELIERMAALENENDSLRSSIAGLKKTREEEVKSVSRAYEALMQEMKSEIAQGMVTVNELKGRLTVDVLDPILFEPGQASIRPEGLSFLRRLSQILKTVRDREIRIEGHTDNTPVGGETAQAYPTLWEFSAAKALHVTRSLLQLGLDAAPLTVRACGEYRPVADNGTPEGRERNRRVAVVIQPRD